MRVVRKCLIGIGLSLLVILVSPEVATADCRTGVWRIKTIDGTGSFGVSGKILTIDVASPNNGAACAWAAIVGVNLGDGSKWVEGGWMESSYEFPSFPNGKHPWSASQWTNFYMNTSDWISISPGTYHEYKFVSQSIPGGEYTWDFYYDGQNLDTWTHAYASGVPGAQHERKNLSDGDNSGGNPVGSGHWHTLKKYDVNRNPLNFPSLTQQDDNDPEYKWCKYSNTLWRVKPNSQPC